MLSRDQPSSTPIALDSGIEPEDTIDIAVVALPNSTVSGMAFDLREIPTFLFGMAWHYGTSADRIQVIHNRTTFVCEYSPCIRAPALLTLFSAQDGASMPTLRPSMHTSIARTLDSHLFELIVWIHVRELQGIRATVFLQRLIQGC
jgi:hypothetical protein